MQWMGVKVRVIKKTRHLLKRQKVDRPETQPKKKMETDFHDDNQNLEIRPKLHIV